ncbi:MAG: hypothetical protein LBT42_00970, partial [Tannerella sp.]|nr:hypothetical protein [Tannerella sp.]
MYRIVLQIIIFLSKNICLYDLNSLLLQAIKKKWYERFPHKQQMLSASFSPKRERRYECRFPPRTRKNIKGGGKFLTIKLLSAQCSLFPSEASAPHSSVALAKFSHRYGFFYVRRRTAIPCKTVVTQPPDSGRLLTPVETQPPNSGRLPTPVVIQPPNSGRLPTPVVIQPPNSGRLSSPVVTQPPNGGRLSSPVVTLSPNGGRLSTPVETQPPNKRPFRHVDVTITARHCKTVLFGRSVRVSVIARNEAIRKIMSNYI